MAKKQSKIFKQTLFTYLILVGFIIFFVPQNLTNKLQFAFVRVFNKPLSICRNFTLMTSNQQSLSNIVDRNKYIRLQNHLANNIQWLRQERQNVEKLSGLRNRSIWEGVSFVLADVITAFTDISRNEFIINRGKNDGLAKGQFVLGNNSIVGTISDLDAHIARVQLLTDPRSRITVKIGELDLQCIMQGNGNDSARIQLISKKYKIENGDIIYVQKKPGFLDIPMIAGIVVQCKTDDENPLLWEIKVKPACDIQRLKSVTVIIMTPQEQTKNDKTTTKISTGALKTNEEKLR
ncbi:MAG: rod shape-determining protein MreC [Candidatus Heimdallarchaeota archaeon]|nr:rod shape-determining protein MreC [Candidatus Heimdallarchaeota archaeon]